jgi:uncharacterized protein DUF5615
LTLRLHLDEDVDTSLGTLLVRDGFDVLTTRDAGRAAQRIGDEAQLRFAASEGWAIFTHNTDDYARLAREWAEAGLEHHGIIVSARHDKMELRRRFRLFTARYPRGMANLFDFL